MASKERANPVKMLVISMGFVLMGGTVMLMGVVWKKVGAETAKMKIAAECAGGKVDLKGHGQVVNTLIDKNIMRVTLKKGAGSLETVSIDLCAGKLMGALELETDK